MLGPADNKTGFLRQTAIDLAVEGQDRIAVFRVYHNSQIIIA